jgi:hypothetical protein
MVAALLGLRIVETPVRWINSDASKVRMLKDAPRMAIDIVRFRWRHFTGEYERRRAEFASAAAPSEPVADDAREDSALDEPEALSAHGRRSISPRIH